MESATSLAPFLSTLNEIRRSQLALQHDKTLRFHRADNERVIAYSKTVPGAVDPSDGLAAAPVLVIVNLDDKFRQSSWLDLDLALLGLADVAAYDVNDLLTGARYRWEGGHNFVMLDPDVTPAHIFRIEPAAAATS
jgi:starch synthase (maltosyl-transferring)